jgi:hypothetical protein
MTDVRYVYAFVFLYIFTMKVLRACVFDTYSHV